MALDLILRHFKFDPLLLLMKLAQHLSSFFGSLTWLKFDSALSFRSLVVLAHNHVSSLRLIHEGVLFESHFKPDVL